MFRLIKIQDTVRVPPKFFGKNLEESLLDLTQADYEGIFDEDTGIIIAVTEAKKIGEGKVVPGDGAAYYSTEIEMLVFRPKIHEVVEAKVSEITEFGAFVRVGPMEGLVHVSQIMDEYLNHDSKNAQFIGKESKKVLRVDDSVIARIVTVSMKSSLSDSKLGLTMRQPFLGKKEWVEAEIRDKKKPKAKPKKEEKKPKKKAAKKKKEGKRK